MEEWRTIEGFPNYAVSNMGQIKKIGLAKGSHKQIGDKIKPYKVGGGYYAVRLSNKSGRKMFKMHRLVLTAFVGKPKKNEQGNHKTGIKSDNCIDNLEWVTQAENMQHSFKNGFHKREPGEKAPNAKLKDGEVWLIKQILAKTSLTQIEISKMFNVSNTTVHRIQHGYDWDHIAYP